MAANGAGSLENIKDTVAFMQIDNGNPPAVPRDDIPWCKCGKCRLMPKEKENKCCGRVNCVTNYNVFNKVCLDRDVLEVAIKTRNDYRAEEIEFSTDSYRHSAYCQFVMWKYGRLGKDNRRVIPSCCVWRIRMAFPSPDGIYTGYKDKHD